MTTYKIEIDGGQGGDCEHEAESIGEAVQYADEWTREGDWDTSHGTVYCDVRVTEIIDHDDIEARLTALADGRDVLDCSRPPHTYGWYVMGARGLDLSALRAALPECCTIGDVDADGDIVIECIGETRDIEVSIDQEEPECNERSHDWKSPYSVLGGIKENPGVWGHGGGLIIRECCRHCGMYRVTDTWAQRMDTGEQGLTEVTYEDADEASSEWVARNRGAV